MNKLLNKLNIVNAILKVLWKIRGNVHNIFMINEYALHIFDNTNISIYMDIYGWHWDNSYHKHNWTTYDRSIKDENGIHLTSGFMLYPNSRIDFYGKIGEIDGKQSAYWTLQQELGKYSEIDVVEYDKRLGKLLFTSYYNPKSKWMNNDPEINKLNQSIQSQGKIKVEESFVREKHLYSVKWGYKRILGVKIYYITWYLDDIPIAFTLRNVPTQPMFLCMNNIKLEWIEWVQVN